MGRGARSGQYGTRADSSRGSGKPAAPAVRTPPGQCAARPPATPRHPLKRARPETASRASHRLDPTLSDGASSTADRAKPPGYSILAWIPRPLPQCPSPLCRVRLRAARLGRTLSCMHWRSLRTARRLTLIASIGLIGAVSVCVAVDGDRQARQSPIVVVIDAGHGGHDPGASGAGGAVEKDITLAVARLVASEAASYPNLCVVLTRTEDRYLDLRARLAVAQKARAAVYVSLHANAGADANAQGVETYPSASERTRAASQQLAQALQSAVVSATRSKDRGVRNGPFYIDRAAMPAALLEMGFITQSGEAKALKDPSVQRKIAAAVVDAIARWVEQR